MKNRSLIGWVVAAVLGVALVGVIVYEEAIRDTGGGTSASGPAGIAGADRGQVPPPDVAPDVNKITEEKNAASKDTLPPLTKGQEPTRLDQNPPRQCDLNGEPNVFAEWKNNPESLSGAGAMAAHILVGTVVGAEPGKPMVSQVPGEPGGVVETPIEMVTLKIDQSIKGSAKVGGTLTIERLGDDKGCFRVAGDPPYQRGQQVLLLLENGLDGRAPHAISPAGRYGVGRDGTLELMHDNPFPREVQGLKLDEVLAKLKG